MVTELRIGSSDQELDELRILVRKGHLFAVQEWIAEEKPIFVKVDRFRNHQCPLIIAVESGFHSMVQILADVWPDDESLVDAIHIAADKPRLDIVWMLLPHVANLKLICLHTIAGCNDKDLMKYFLDRWDEVDNEDGLQSIVLAMPRPLTGLIREYAPRLPNSQFQLACAMRSFVRKNHPRWVGLTLWMGGDPRLRVPDLQYDDHDYPEGWLSPIEEAVNAGSVQILKLMKPSPDRDDMNQLFAQVSYFRDTSLEVMEYLLKCGAPINGAENGGSLILSKFFSCSYRYGFKTWATGPTYAEIEFLKKWIQLGAKWVPTEGYELTDARKTLRYMRPERIWEFLKILSGAVDEPVLLKLCNSDIVRDALRLGNSEIREGISEVYRPKRSNGMKRG